MRSSYDAFTEYLNASAIIAATPTHRTSRARVRTRVADDADVPAHVERRKATRKTASKTASKAPAVTDPNEKRVLSFLKSHGESHEDTMADHIAAQVGGQTDTESIVYAAVRRLESRKMVRRVGPARWALA